MNPSSRPSKEVAADSFDKPRAAIAAPPLATRRLKISGAVYFAVLLLAFAKTLLNLAVHAAGSELHSYVLLVPFISAYLIYIQSDRLPKIYSPAIGVGSLAAFAGLVAWAAALCLGPWSENDYLTAITFSFVCFLIAGALFFLGRKWIFAVAFPVAFLIFFVPMPDAMAKALEIGSQFASAEAASFFFTLSGTPFLREGNYFQLPNIALQVAQECSGIRSTWILFITSLLASNLFLRGSWRRLALVAFVIPLGILRNGFRILVIGLLCVHYGPNMINSPIHRHGGPQFFALSLVPLFLLLWWLRRGEADPAQQIGADVTCSSNSSDPEAGSGVT